MRVKRILAAYLHDKGKTTMFKLITTFLTAAALSLSFSSAPAIADSKNTERFVAAAALVALLGLAAHESKKRTTSKPVETKKPDGWKNHNQKNKRKSLPLTCLKKYRLKGGENTAFSKTCLDNKFHYAKQMPSQCQQVFWTNNGTRKVYQPKCLRRFGYEARNYH